MKFFYIVKPNDTLLTICEQFKIEPSKLIEINHLENYELKKGDCIEIPSGNKN